MIVLTISFHFERKQKSSSLNPHGLPINCVKTPAHEPVAYQYYPSKILPLSSNPNIAIRKPLCRQAGWKLHRRLFGAWWCRWYYCVSISVSNPGPKGRDFLKIIFIIYLARDTSGANEL